MKKIESFEQACELRGIDPKNLPVVDLLPLRHQKAIVAFYKLTIIFEATNEGRLPNYRDYSELKYGAWPDVKTTAKQPSGVGLSFFDWTLARTFTDVGARLTTFSRDELEYVFTQHKSLYEDYLLIFPDPIAEKE